MVENLPELNPIRFPESDNSTRQKSTSYKIQESPIRPKNILVILSGRKPYQKVNMIVNKRTVMSMDQLISDISKALGRPKV